MDVTRREFIACTAAAAAGAALLPEGLVASPDRETITWLHGDPYTACVHEGGLGGATFESAREQAMRFRSADVDRDEFVLGLELRHA